MKMRLTELYFQMNTCGQEIETNYMLHISLKLQRSNVLMMLKCIWGPRAAEMLRVLQVTQAVSVEDGCRGTC